ncbi:pentapeptide repeat-containing protein [Streptomyces sp. NPDC053069]|uniref:pentapeptide repeat-containing protein n=1 Tax=Streptomyces sp. NPDC053069 TaxID=3365695 RepID=UPI0037CF2BD0
MSTRRAIASTKPAPCAKTPVYTPNTSPPAVTQLGEKSEAVRLGAVHALAGLADDAPISALRQTCIEVLRACLHLPYTAEVDLPADDARARNTYLALREVRHTVIRVIRDRLRPEPGHPHSWAGLRFDFTGVTFDGGNFRGAKSSGATVDFSSAKFFDASVSFRGATFSGAKVTFRGATFSVATVDLSTARGRPPSGLVPASDKPLSDRLFLPPEWYPAKA